MSRGRSKGAALAPVPLWAGVSTNPIPRLPIPQCPAGSAVHPVPPSQPGRDRWDQEGWEEAVPGCVCGPRAVPAGSHAPGGVREPPTPLWAGQHPCGFPGGWVGPFLRDHEQRRGSQLRFVPAPQQILQELQEEGPTSLPTSAGEPPPPPPLLSASLRARIRNCPFSQMRHLRLREVTTPRFAPSRPEATPALTKPRPPEATP